MIGAVLIPGAQAPRLVRREDLKRMMPAGGDHRRGDRPGRLRRDGRPTTHSKPTYIVDDVVHYCVTNMPGAVGRTSTYALTNVTLPYVLQMANKGVDRAVAENPALRRGREHPARQGDERRRRGDVRVGIGEIVWLSS